jgi:GntR family transcriptional regulator
LNESWSLASIAAVATAVTPFRSIAAEHGSAPLYRQAKRALLEAIEDGRCPPGRALPAETALAAALGVSVGTLRHAVDELVADHVLVRQQGRGTFVATHSSDRFLFQFFHVESRDGRREAPQVQLLSFERERLDDDDAAAALALRPGTPAIAVENVLLLQGRPVVHDRLLLPATLFKGLTEKRMRERPGTIYQLYQSDFGITVLRASERARAVAADRHTARALHLATGTPVMQVRRIAQTFGDRPVEYRVSTLDTSRHDYVHLLSRPGGGA